MNNRQILLNIIMDAIDAKSEYIALLVKYKNKNRNTIEIESKDNIVNILKEITDKDLYNDELYGKSKNILSAVAFDNNFSWEDIVEALSDNIFDLNKNIM